MKMITEISKGKQITIPAEIRKKLKLKAGSRVEIERKGNKIVIEPIEEDLQKFFEESWKIRPKRHPSPEEIDEIAENELS